MQKELVLIVDDQMENLQVMAGVLKDYYNISIANNGEKAIKIAKQKKPALILLDVMMPGMTGFEVCKILKEGDDTKEIPIIFLTAKTETDDIITGFETGAVDYITKPFQQKEVLVRIKTHVELYRSRKKIEKQSTELEEMLAKLQEINASKDKFFSIISHDLKGPFNSILGLAQIINEDFESLSKEEIKEITSTFHKSANNLYKLLENLLEWSRMQMGAVKFTPLDIRLSDLIRKTIITLEPTAKAKEIEIVFNSDSEYYIEADIKMTETVMRNLISNAIKFSYRKGKIEISSEEFNDELISISFKDYGIGMNETTKEKLFQVDQKVSQPGTENEPSTGLGLILCKDFVEKIGGRIFVESTLEEGTTFIFTVPKSKNI